MSVGCNNPTSYKPSSEMGWNQLCRRQIGTTTALHPTFGLGDRLPVLVQRFHSSVQEGDASLRATFFVQIQFARSSSGILSLLRLSRL
ncbi:hypothetical protein K443DRAFT_15921 [Laccaria amethystina LaAM-08-1]|uniref:Uncharacterized protein n=1 Tax=Laccaria amethystina LaAM-08-1 TaxID=1095629 RepID=A0A0C9WGL1_9AGAR|nr:hypothetical protein K443DRAFT_15921 [Laccaria amethystina LaAM-08-1]